MTVEVTSFVWMIIGLIIFIGGPIGLSFIWLKKKDEQVTTILVGVGVFLLFVFFLEKPIQNLVAFPTAMGLPDHAVSNYLNSKPILLAFIVGLFPGVFEEAGRLVAFKTLLKKRTNRETSISYGLGHGGGEVAILLGLTYVNYIVYSIMLNTGLFQIVEEQVKAQAPDQMVQLEQIVTMLISFSGAAVMLAVVERIFAVMFHIGASVLVFYACRDKSKVWLFPLAIILHTAMDFVAGLVMFDVISVSDWGLEVFIAIFGIAVFFSTYFLLYKKDSSRF